MKSRTILGAAGMAACLSCAAIGTNALAEKSKFAEDGMARNSKRDIDVSVRNTRPARDRHMDARKCLKGDKNEDIIKCAQKYR